MTKMYLLTNIALVSTIIVICAISRCDGIISDKRLCYDPKCSEPVSLARTLLPYNSVESHILSFPSNIQIKIFSKEAGSRLDLWGAEVKGKRGYVPKSFVRESKKIQSKLSYEVPTELYEQEVNATDKLNVNASSHADSLPNNSTFDDEAIGIIDKLKTSKGDENVETAGAVHPLESIKQVDDLTSNDDEKPVIDSYNTGAEESIEQKAQEISGSGVQNVMLDDKDSDSNVNASNLADSSTSNKTFPVKTDSTVDILNGPEDDKYESADVDPLETVEDMKDTKEPTDTIPATNNDDSNPAVDPLNSDSKESIHQIGQEILDGVQNVKSAYEVIDGTMIPFLAEEVQIKPSYPTPVIATAAVSNEEPILSIHPKLPTTIRPLISRFSNPDNANVVTDDVATQPDIFVETETDETNSAKESITIQGNADNSMSSEPDTSKNSEADENPKADVPEDNNHSDDISTSETAEPLKDITEDVSNVVSSGEYDVNNELGVGSSFDNPGNVSRDLNSNEGKELQVNKAADISVDDIFEEKLEAAENITDELHKENENFNTEPSLEMDQVLVVPETDSNEEHIHQKEPVSDKILSEIAANTNKLKSSIPEHEFQDSGEQTQSLSSEKIGDTSKEVQVPDNVEEKTLIEGTEIPVSSSAVEQHDNQVTVNNSMPQLNNDFTLRNTDEGVEVETKIEDESQKYSSQETAKSSYASDELKLSAETVTIEPYLDSEDDKLTTSRTLLTFEDGMQDNESQSDVDALNIDKPEIHMDISESPSSQEYENYIHEMNESAETPDLDSNEQFMEISQFTNEPYVEVAPPEVCDINSDCTDLDNGVPSTNEEQDAQDENEESILPVFEQHNYLETLLYLTITAVTTLLFSLGYYYVENQRRDKELIAKINVLEKELLVSTKENMMLDEGLKTTKNKLNSIEDESFGSNEMVLSLKSELETAQITKGELEDQILTLEKELEGATEAGLELERMLREFLASQSDENPLAQSVEDLQTRLNAQQATNESLTNNLNLKSQENEALSTELAATQERYQQLEVEVTRLVGELKSQSNVKNSLEKELSVKTAQLVKQVNKLSDERVSLINELTSKEVALNDLSAVVKQQNTENFDLDKLYDVSHIKAEAQLLTKERDDLKIKLTEVEGAHQLLEEHMKLIKEEIAAVTEQYELAERDKTEAQTRLEVLSNYFKEKESQLQKELGMQEAMWVQKQGEVTSTVDRIQTMQNEIQNYRQQIETLKREILDQEREYKSQIATLETKSHEQWVISRQNERRLEESKAEASQLRNRLTMVEKSINEVDSDSKLHRLETNGETASSPQLFMGAETSSSPIIFTGSSGVPPLPPSYMYGGPLPPHFLPPPPHSGGGPMYDISRRPPPLGGRLSSPPPIPLHHPPGRYADANSPPPPLSPPLHAPYSHRSPPPFSNDRIHQHPPPPFLPPLGTSHSWGDEPLPPLRNPVFHPHQREHRVRNHKGSLHSSGDSLDKPNHIGKS